ncbi:hypothetical protein ACHAQA_001125 [Verticillium albo-atrum]
MDLSFRQTHDAAFLDYLLDDPEQPTSPSATTRLSPDTLGGAVDHLQGGGVRAPGHLGDHAMPAGHRTTPNSAHQQQHNQHFQYHPPPPPPPLHRPAETLPQDPQARDERVLAEPLFHGPLLHQPVFGNALHVNPQNAAPSAIQSQHPDWSFPGFGALPLSFPPTDTLLGHGGRGGATNVVDFGAGGAGGGLATSPDDYAGNITPLPILSGTRPTFDFDFDFHSPSWGPSLDDAMSSSLVVGAGTSHPRRAMDDESDNRDSFWADEDDSSLGRPSPAAAARKRVDKGKRRADSLDGASSSIFSTGTDDTGPLPHPSPGLGHGTGSGSGSGRGGPGNSPVPAPVAEFPKPTRRSNRPTRAKSVATTASASSSSANAPSETGRQSAAAAAVRLRSASRASKNAARRPSESAEERRTRASHNLVEKQYRSRLNAQFEGLLSALPELPASQQQVAPASMTASAAAETPEDQGERRISKAEVLERARRHIETLEREREALHREREELLKNLAKMEQDVGVRFGEDALGDSMHGSSVAVVGEEEQEEEEEEEKKKKNKKKKQIEDKKEGQR